MPYIEKSVYLSKYLQLSLSTKHNQVLTLYCQPYPVIAVTVVKASATFFNTTVGTCAETNLSLCNTCNGDNQLMK